MTWQLIEDVVDSAITYIEANETAMWAAVEARYTTNALTMADFAAIRMSDPDREHEPEYPVLYVVPTQAEFEFGAGGMSRGFVAEHRVVFVIVAHHAGDNDETPAETLSRLLKRYTVGLMELLGGHCSTAVTGYRSNVEWATGRTPRIQYRTFRNASTGEYIGTAELEIGVTMSEGAL